MSESSGDRRGSGRFHFEASINLGHILTMVVFIVGLAVSWGQLNSRVTALETLTIAHEKIIVELQISNAKLTALMEMYVPQLQRTLNEQSQRENKENASR